MEQSPTPNPVVNKPTSNQPVSVSLDNGLVDELVGNRPFEPPLDKFLRWVFQYGFASIFLVNAVYAAIHPADFTHMLEVNPITSAIGHTDFLVKITMVNDISLGILIIVGKQKKFVYAWAGAWLLLVAGIKLMNLFY